MVEQRITWTDAQARLMDEGFEEVPVRLALGTLLDGELELEQEDDEERVISAGEFARVLDQLRADG